MTDIKHLLETKSFTLFGLSFETNLVFDLIHSVGLCFLDFLDVFTVSFEILF
jgi:hypothetical protein